MRKRHLKREIKKLVNQIGGLEEKIRNLDGEKDKVLKRRHKLDKKKLKRLLETAQSFYEGNKSQLEKIDTKLFKEFKEIVKLDRDPILKKIRSD